MAKRRARAIPSKNKIERVEHEDFELSSDEASEADDVHEDAKFMSVDVDETPAEKRIRLAEEMLSHIKQKKFDDGDSDVDISEELRKSDLQQKGQFVHKVADMIAGVANESGFIDLKSESVSHEEIVLCGKSITCLALHHSEAKSFVVCGSKDCNIYKVDLESKEIKMCKGLISSKAFKNVTNFPGHRKEIMCVDVSFDGSLIASGSMEKNLLIWDSESCELVHTFKGHRDSILGVAFEKNETQPEEEMKLYSCGKDRTLRIWDVNAKASIDEQFGHSSDVTAIDTLSKPRVVTCSKDLSVRLWKIPEETQLVFDPKSRDAELVHQNSIDCVKFIDDNHFVSGGEDATIKLWHLSKKKPVDFVKSSEFSEKWISSLARLRNSDVFVSATEGEIQIFKVDTVEKSIESCVARIKVKGHVNGLAFGNLIETDDGFEIVLVAGVGSEPRFGRWNVVTNTKGSLHIYRIALSN